MAAYPLDTAAVVRDLENAGIEHRQAEAIVTAIVRAQDGLATKADVRDLKADLHEIKVSMEAVESRMVTGIADLRADLAGHVNKLLLALIAVAGLLFAVIKLFG